MREKSLLKKERDIEATDPRANTDLETTTENPTTEMDKIKVKVKLKEAKEEDTTTTTVRRDKDRTTDPNKRTNLNKAMTPILTLHWKENLN